MNQLSRIIRQGSAGSPDEQAVAPDERGSYGELMDEIDLLLAVAPAEATGLGTAEARSPLWTEREEA